MKRASKTPARVTKIEPPIKGGTLYSGFAEYRSKRYSWCAGKGEIPKHVFVEYPGYAPPGQTCWLTGPMPREVARAIKAAILKKAG